MSSPKPQDTYETRDLHFAAYLDVHIGVLGARAKEEKGHKIFYFQFPRVPNLKFLKTQYFSGEGTVSAKRYRDSIGNLRALMK